MEVVIQLNIQMKSEAQVPPLPSGLTFMMPRENRCYSVKQIVYQTKTLLINYVLVFIMDISLAKFIMKH